MDELYLKFKKMHPNWSEDALHGAAYGYLSAALDTKDNPNYIKQVIEDYERYNFSILDTKK